MKKPYRLVGTFAMLERMDEIRQWISQHCSGATAKAVMDIILKALRSGDSVVMEDKGTVHVTPKKKGK